MQVNRYAPQPRSGPKQGYFWRSLIGATWVAITVVCQAQSVSVMTFEKGDATFVDGTFYSLLEVIPPPPGPGPGPSVFGVANGHDVIGPNFQASWTFDNPPISSPDVIGAARITIGIYDHDSASPGNQTALFSVDGSDLTSLMGNEMEGGGGDFEAGSNKPEYNEYTVTLPASLHAGIMTGSTMVALDLQGSVMNPGIPSLSIPSQEDPNNGAHLLFSSLEITIVPEPGSYALASGLTLLGAAIYRRRMKGGHHAV